ncbi:MAG: DUF72 domain-containing protein [Nitrospiraceae bacterium]
MEASRRDKSGEAGKLYVGTAGWSYSGWDKIFYPEKVKSTYERLAFYSRSFNAVEVNYSFYHLPKPETCARWSEIVLKDFHFAVKASRFITHVKRLEGVGEAWEKFLASVRVLGDRLGPILFQFPPSLQADLDRLERFLSLVKLDRKTPRVRPVFEFRHRSWFTEASYDLLRDAGATLCIAHSSRYPYVEEVTAALIYYRFHGPKELFASKYGDEQLHSWATQMRQHLNAGKAVHAYFNNDVHGYAVENARTLRALVSP